MQEEDGRAGSRKEEEYFFFFLFFWDELHSSLSLCAEFFFYLVCVYQCLVGQWRKTEAATECSDSLSCDEFCLFNEWCYGFFFLF